MATAATITSNPAALWREHVRFLLAEAARMIVDRSIPLPKRVHEARRAAKQGRALLKLAPKPARDAARTARAALRELRKSLGPARDARVALTTQTPNASRRC